MSEGTRNRHYISYARICVYIDVSLALPEAVRLIYRDEISTQNIDYEHITFRFRKCHEHGHLFRECPQNKALETEDHTSKKKDEQGYTKVGNKHKQSKISYTKKDQSKVNTTNMKL